MLDGADATLEALDGVADGGGGGTCDVAVGGCVLCAAGIDGAGGPGNAGKVR